MFFSERSTPRAVVITIGLCLVLVASALAVSSGAAEAQAAATCMGETATHVGTDGDDNLVGTNDRDVFVTGAGDDTIRSFGGNDLICAGDGIDRIKAGEGDDTVYGGLGTDYIWGAGGADEIHGEGGSDRIYAGADDDVVFAGSGADRVWGDGGNDTIRGMGGRDTIFAGEGDDTVLGNWQSDQIEGGPGMDFLSGNEGKDVISGGDGPDTLRGGLNRDTLRGDAGDDILFGDVSYDALFGGPGTDELNGGRHTDTCEDDSSTDFTSCEEITRTETPTPAPAPTVVAVAEGSPCEGCEPSAPALSDGGIGGVVAGPIPGPGPGDEGIQPEPGTLTAADIDDNLNFDQFTAFLARSLTEFADSGSQAPSVNLDDRITFDVETDGGAVVANAKLDVVSGSTSTTIYTNSAGIAHLFPTYAGLADGPLTVTVVATNGEESGPIPVDPAALGDDRVASFNLPSMPGGSPSALDVAIVLDTTGSMSDELRYLTVEFQAIVSQLRADHPGIDMRFGLITYRDIGDEYVTRAFDFTSDVATMQAQLAAQQAQGGGDYPEAMDEALVDANDLSWRTGDVSRVLFLNADAPPHDENLVRALGAGQTLTERGVRMYPLAASGVGDTAEYMMRIMAATSGGRHLFLTDDSGVGGEHQEPKIPCYVATALDSLMIRVLAAEITGERVEAPADEIIRTVGTYQNGVCL